MKDVDIQVVVTLSMAEAVHLHAHLDEWLDETPRGYTDEPVVRGSMVDIHNGLEDALQRAQAALV